MSKQSKESYKFSPLHLDDEEEKLLLQEDREELQLVTSDDMPNSSIGKGNAPSALKNTSALIASGEEGSPSDEIIQRPLEPKRVLTSLALLFVSLAVLAFALFSAYRRSNNQSKVAFQQITLAKLTTSGKAVRAAISRDGKYVAYVVEEGDQQSLLVRQASATSSAAVVAPTDARFRGVTFSPDDRSLYYVTQPKGEMLSNLYQVPVLGGTPRKVMSDVNSSISFSPNSQYFAFVRNYPAQREVSLIAAKLDGSEERKLLTRKQPEMLSLQGPAWSPDGSRIACAAGTIAGADSIMRVLVVNLADGSDQPIGEQTWTTIGQVAWLGDGSGVVFNGWRRTSAVYGDQLWLLTFPKGEARRITNDTASYDGVSIATGAADSGALVSERTEGAINGSDPKQLTQFTTDQTSLFAGAHDGKALDYERGTAMGDVVLIRSGKTE
ncbi:MAG: hypothetical protein ABIU20_00480 [Blastocatellia bacterium]